MKKVLQFIHGLNMGGAETLVKEYCLKLDKNKYDVSVLCFYQYHTPIEKQLEEAGIKITYIDDINDYKKEGGITKLRRIRFFLKRIICVRNYIKKEQPDIIHSHLNSNTYVWLAGPKKGTKIFHTIHNELSELWDDSIEGKLDFYASKKLIESHQMRFITLHERMRVETDQFFKVDNTTVLNNGIDFEKFESALPKTLVRKREGIPENAFVVGHIGRFNEQKNHKFLVDIFYEIYQKNREAYLLMVGNGDLMSETQDKLDELGLKGRYKILSYRMDIPDLLSAMDCFVFPSLFEGLSVVMIEAQKMMLPCFVSNTIEKATQISNLICWNDLKSPAKEWADKILKNQINAVEYDNLDFWNMKNVVRCLENIYEELIRG